MAMFIHDDNINDRRTSLYVCYRVRRGEQFLNCSKNCTFISHYKRAVFPIIFPRDFRRDFHYIRQAKRSQLGVNVWR